jgi:hypothetical protein
MLLAVNAAGVAIGTGVEVETTLGFGALLDEPPPPHA